MVYRTSLRFSMAQLVTYRRIAHPDTTYFIQPIRTKMKSENSETPKQGQHGLQGSHPSEALQGVLDFDSDAPLVCNRDQSGDTTCESCQ